MYRAYRALQVVLTSSLVRRLMCFVLFAAAPCFAQYQCAATASSACTINVVTGGADIGADINSAVAACSASGCLINVPPGTYTLTTAMNITKSLRLHLAAGTYSATVGASNNVITLGAPGVVLEGDGPATIIHATDAAIGVDIPAAGSGSIVRDLTVEGPCGLNGTQCNTQQTPSEGINAGSATGVTVTDVIVENWGNHGINTGGFSTGWHVQRVTTQSNYNDGILVAQDSNYGVLDGVTAQNNGGNGIDINSAYTSVTNSTSTQNGYNNSSRGVDCWGVLISSVAGTEVNADANFISGNRVYNNYCHQIIIRAEDASYHANWNTITANYISGGVDTASYANASGIVIDASIPNGGTIEGTLIGDNAITSMPNDGILIGGGVGEGTQANNTIRHNRLLTNGQGSSGGYGIQIWTGSSAILDRNTFVSNVTGSFIVGGSSSSTYLQEESTTFANLNTHEGSGSQIWCADCRITTPCTGSGTGAWAFAAAGGTWKCPF